MPPDTPHDDAGAVGGPAPGGPPPGGRRAEVRPLRVVPGGSEEPDWELVARVLAGEGTATDRAAVARWAAADLARRAELDALGRWWEAAASLPTPARVDAMWRELSARLPDRDSGTRPASEAAPPHDTLRLVSARDERPGPSRRWRRAGALAAATVLATASGLAWWRLGARPRPTLANAAAREVVTRRGQQATVTLGDGSRVTLGPESRLRVHAFARARQVELRGEAVFVVRHDPARPFLVHAAHAVTEDLGTAFGVRAYPGDSVVRVVVEEGAVALRATAAPIGTGTRLGPGDVGRLDPNGRVAVSAGRPAADLAWARGRVVFDNAPLGDVAAEIGRRYDASVRVARAADARRRVTVDMAAGSIGEVLDAVTVPLALVHYRQGDTVVVGPSPRSARAR